jgi:hypothetical protein
MLMNWRFALVLSLCAVGVVGAAAMAGDDKAPPAKPAAPPASADAEREKWAEHMGDLPFVIGYEKGMKEVEFTGRPPMYFFTATW